jgi:Tfp pilus assembly protein PilF
MASPQPPSYRDSRVLADLLARAIHLHQGGLWAQAEPYYLRLLQAAPGHFDGLHMLGVLRHQQGRDAEALELIDRALAQRPGSPWALSNRGVVLSRIGRHTEALACFDRALEISPDDPEVLNNRGNVLRALRRPAEALASYDRALARKPDYADAVGNRANALQDLGHHDEALVGYARALALAPDHLDSLYNRGAALLALCRHAEAIETYQRVLALKPDHGDAHWNEALARLAVGDFAEGWKKFEWRWKTSDAKAAPDWPCPLWLGETALESKSILLYGEQGIGDTLHLVRYAPLVAARGAAVRLVVHRELKALVAGMSGLDVFGEDDVLPLCDLRCPLLSLPLAFGTRLETIPAQIPYLRASGERIARWRGRLRPARRRVGLVWAGNPRHANDARRSIPFAVLAPLLAIPNVDFVSLQKEVPPGDREALRGAARIVDLAPELGDFADTAAAMTQLDLVICVDTAVAHLAGALGKPVWVLLPFSPDWRWLLHRQDSPWYPTARLFRQPAIGDWTSVIARVASELRA